MVEVWNTSPKERCFPEFAYLQVFMLCGPLIVCDIYMFFLLFIACQSELSIAVVNRQTNTIVGGDFLFNYFIDDLEQLNLEHHDSMRPIVALLDLLERPVKRRLANESDLKRRQSPNACHNATNRLLVQLLSVR
jgi:hypothetical protein